MKPFAAAVVIAAIAFTACNSKNPGTETAKPGMGTVHREGQPDYFPVSDNAEMDKAVQAARDSVDTFIAAIKTPKAGQRSFTVKKPFKDGDKVEHIWLSDATFDGTKFSGRVDNDPVDVKNVTMGQTASVAKGELSDWFYIDNGKLVGGYTIRVLYAQMSPDDKKNFDAHAGFKMD